MKKLKLLYYDFKMPYLIKDADYPIGGATVEWYSWIKGFEENNCDVGVLTWKGSKSYCENSDIQFIESYCPNKGIRKLRWLYYRMPILYKAIKQYKPDVIIQECAGSDTGIMAFMAMIIGVPFIYRVANDMDIDDRLKKMLSFRDRLLFSFGLKNSSAILCQNSYQYENLLSKFEKSKIHIICNPIYNDRINSINNFSKRNFVAWVGLFQYQKNLPALYEVAKSLPDIEFHIAGRKSSNNLDADTNKALIKLGNCKNVKFVGYLKRKEICPFLSKAYALLNTSHYEGFSNTYLEAFISGTPVVTTVNANPDNLIDEKKLGIVVNEISEFKQAILTIMKENIFNDFSNNCQKQISKAHNPKVLAKKVKQIITKIKK